MSIGPIRFTTQGDAFILPARIASVLWEGATVSGDRVELRARGGNELLWPCRTDSQQTYLGKTFTAAGLHAPNGFYCAVLSAGQLLVYLKES